MFKVSWIIRVDQSAVQYEKTIKYRNITVQLHLFTSGFQAKMLGTPKSILSAALLSVNLELFSEV